MLWFEVKDKAKMKKEKKWTRLTGGYEMKITWVILTCYAHYSYPYDPSLHLLLRKDSLHHLCVLFFSLLYRTFAC
jgi:hypothetical protein